MGLQTNTQPHSWIAPASSSFVNLTATNFNFTNGILNTRLDLQPNSCLVGNNTTCVIAGNIAHTLIDATSSIKPVRGFGTASAIYSTVVGGLSNTASASGAFVGGGSSNTASGLRSFIGGGCNNTASNSGSVILAGRQNIASGASSLVTTGTTNSATNTDAVVLGGVSNCASNTRSTVGNGCLNIASGDYSTILNGFSNQSSNSFTFIGNGKNNTASGIYTSVVAGLSNSATGSYNVIGGGSSNATSNAYTIINGGKNNTVSGNYSIIGGGISNRVSGNCSGNLGGCNNVVSHNNSFTVGSNLTSSSDNTLFVNNLRTNGNLSAYNIAADGWFYGNGYYLSNLNPATVPANYPYCYSIGINSITTVTPATGTVLVNMVSGVCGGILAGGNNTIGAVGSFSIIAGGRNNYIKGACSSIGGGINNNIESSIVGAGIASGSLNSVSATNANIAGGCCNSITTGSAYANVAGGACNTASGTYTAINGGSYNSACQSWAAVNGGTNNTASGYAASVVNGDFNIACGTNSNIAGGHRNNITGGVSNIDGGYCNSVNGWFSGIGSGSCNVINNNFANIVGGNANIANAANTFTLGSNLSADVANYTYVNNLAINTNTPNRALTIVGDISATGTVYGNFSQIVLPSSLTFTGNGTTSTFDLNTTNANTTPASYIVSLNGASQVPINDYNIVYTGGTNKLVTTFVPPFGSTISVILLNSTLFGIGDKAVTLNKLDNGVLSAIALLAAGTNMNVQPASTTTYSIVTTDNGGTIGSLNNTAGLTAIITGTYPVGFQTAFMQLSGSQTTGRITVSAAPDITLNNADGFFKTTKRYSAATLVNTGTTAGWILYGDVNA